MSLFRARKCCKAWSNVGLFSPYSWLNCYNQKTCRAKPPSLPFCCGLCHPRVVSSTQFRDIYPEYLYRGYAFDRERHQWSANGPQIPYCAFFRIGTALHIASNNDFDWTTPQWSAVTSTLSLIHFCKACMAIQEGTRKRGWNSPLDNMRVEKRYACRKTTSSIGLCTYHMQKGTLP